MDYLSTIKQPITAELSDFISLYHESLTHPQGLLGSALDHINQREGKRMRPMLILLIAKHFGGVTKATLHGAVGLELLHTASLVHDDVVDESEERRGQSSVNAEYNNKVAVLVGDYILSTALLQVNYARNSDIVEELSELGRTLTSGEILQLENISNQAISEETYYRVIHQKTAAFFETCVAIGALSAGASGADIAEGKEFGRCLGMMFQIRDDIFDYYDSSEIGKPTGNDMAEGKLTLPVIYAVNTTGNEEMLGITRKVKQRTVSAEEIARLVTFTKANGGIEYAEQCMMNFRAKAMEYLNQKVRNEEIRTALEAYVDYVARRDK